jgi:hypothetical protein
MRARLIAPAVVTLIAPLTAAADITAIGPFVGALREPLNFGFTRISADQPIFGGQANLISHNGVTFIHLLLGSTLGGDAVTPRTGSLILGWTEGPGIFTFSTPVSRFGAYWNNNSGTSGALVEFFDASNSLIGTAPATIPAPGNVWTWNGWDFGATPVSRIRVIGFGIINGFLWTDDLEMTPIPAPASLCVLAPALCLLRRRR